MASHKLFASSSTLISITMAILILLLLTSPTLSSLTCTSQKFTNNNLYDHCTDLPVLSSYLHWTYNSSNSSLSIAFIARPSSSDGWISWAINPTSTGMIGAQALVAFKQQSDASLTVKTYSLSSYGPIIPSKLTFDVWDVSAEESRDGVMALFAKVAVGGGEIVRLVNQVWQVGSVVRKGVPMKHEMEPMNMNAKGTLDLMNEDSMKSSSDAADLRFMMIKSVAEGLVYFFVFVASLITLCLFLE